MLKKILGLTLSTTILLGSVNTCFSVSASAEELSAYETKIKNFDPEYTMWTNQLIEEGFAALSPNQSNSELSNHQQPYGSTAILSDGTNKEKNLTKWAEYELMWTYGYPVGNGRMAAMVMGGIDKEVIQINEDTIWTGSPYEDENGNFTSGTIKDGWKYYRGAKEDGTPADIGSADAIVGDAAFQSAFPAFKNKSISNMALNISNEHTTEAVQHRYDIVSMVEKYFLGKPSRQKSYQSFVETYLDFGQKNSGVTNYTKALDMKNAAVTVDYDYDGVHYTRETIASYPAQTVATNIKSEGGKLDFNAELHTFLDSPSFEKISDNQIKIMAKVPGKETNEPGGKNLIKFEARLMVNAPDSQVSVSEDNKKIIIKGGNEATVYVVGASNYVDYTTLDDSKPAQDCDKYVSKIQGKTYQQIKAEHEKDYKELFERTYISLENNGFDPTGIVTEKRVRKDLPNGENGFSVPGGNNLDEANGKDGENRGAKSTFTEGDNKLATLDFNYGKYLLIAGSRDGSNGIAISQPLNLTGKWNPSTSPSWNGKYTININTEMNYWLAQPLNLAECEKPLLDVFSDLAESGSITAKEQYGISNSRGDSSYQPGDPWVMHHNFDLWRGTQPIDNATAGLWPTGGIWLLDHAWQYYQFNKDEEYLAEFYPLMKGACDFFTQFLVIDPKTGYLITAASCSPEQGSVQPGAAMDTQLIRNLYDETIKAAEILGKDTEDAELIAKMKEQLPEGGYLADEKGKIAPNLIDGSKLIKEWARGDVSFDFSVKNKGEGKYHVVNPFLDASDKNKEKSINEHTASNSTSHRHCSHLWELYPGTHINQYSEDKNEKDIFSAFQNSVDVRSPGDSKGWALAWRTALSARALNGNESYKRIEQLLRCRTSPNMFGQHPNFQIDCNYGLTGGMTEMLLQSHNDTIDILPALPDAWRAGKFKGFKARGNVEVGASWKKGVPTKVSIKSIDGGEIKVRNPYMGTAVVKDSNGNEISSRLESGNTVIVFNADAGVDYDIVGFGEIPAEEGTKIEIWTKTAKDAGDYFNDDGGAVPKPSGEDKIGTIVNNNHENYGGNGGSVGFSYKDCELDSLDKLTIKMNVRPEDVTISVRKDSKDGEEIASVTAQKAGSMDIDIPIKENVSLAGTTKLFIVFTPKKVATTDKYIGDVEYLKGTRTVTYKNDDILKVQKDGENYIKNSITAGDYTFEVDFDKLDGLEKAYIITAFYDEDNTLISDTKQEISKENNKINMTVPQENSKYTMKVMIWNDLDKMQPIRAVREFVG